MLLQGPSFSCPSCLQTLSASIGLFTPPLWGHLLHTLQFSMWKAHLPCLCLAALLPGVSVTCACVSTRIHYL